MNFHSDERIAIFLDGSNLYSSARALGFEIDYKNLLELFSGQGYLVRALYYTAIWETEDDYSPLRPLVDWLEYNGYTLVTKPAKEYTDPTGRRRTKGNMECARLTGASAAGESPAGRRRPATTSTPSHGPSSARMGVKR